jgi:hypothetical protein
MKKSITTIALILLIGFHFSVLGQNKLFVPTDFKVPNNMENELFRIRKMTINDAAKEYDAIMTSVEHLQRILPFFNWPMT